MTYKAYSFGDPLDGLYITSLEEIEPSDDDENDVRPAARRDAKREEFEGIAMRSPRCHRRATRKDSHGK